MIVHLREAAEVAAVAVVVEMNAVVVAVVVAMTVVVVAVAGTRSSAKYVRSMDMMPRSVTIDIPPWALTMRLGPTSGPIHLVRGQVCFLMSGVGHLLVHLLMFPGMVHIGLGPMPHLLFLTGLAQRGMAQTNGLDRAVLDRVSGLTHPHTVGSCLTGVDHLVHGMPHLRLQALLLGHTLSP